MYSRRSQACSRATSHLCTTSLDSHDAALCLQQEGTGVWPPLGTNPCNV